MPDKRYPRQRSLSRRGATGTGGERRQLSFGFDAARGEAVVDARCLLCGRARSGDAEAAAATALPLCRPCYDKLARAGRAGR